MEGLMKAWRIHGEGQEPVLDQVPIPKPKRGEILIKMGGAGICRTDLEIIDGVWKEGAGVGPFPVTLGHENAGWIAEFGEGTQDCGFSIGEAVVVEAKTHCGTCELCRAGLTNFCTSAPVRGCEADGGLAEYMITTPKELVSLGDLDPAVYAVLGDAGHASYGPIREAVCGGMVAKLTPASRILIIGCGGLAGFAIQYARVLTGGTVIVIDHTSEERLDAAVQKGADYAIQWDEDVYDAIMKITNGRLVDAVFDFIGNTESMELAAKVTRMGGLISITGVSFTSQFTFNWSTMKPGVTMRLYQGGTIQDLTAIVSLVKRGLVKAEVQQYDFCDLPKALEDLRNQRIKGRGVIVF